MTTWVGWFKPAPSRRNPTAWEPLIEASSHAVAAVLLAEKVNGTKGTMVIRRKGFGPAEGSGDQRAAQPRKPPTLSITGETSVLGVFRPGEWLAPSQVVGRLFDMAGSLVDCQAVYATLAYLARKDKLVRREIGPAGRRKRYEYGLPEKGTNP